MTISLSHRREERRQRLLGVLRTLDAGDPVLPECMRSVLTARECRDYRAELETLWPQPQGWEKTAFARFKKLVRGGDILQARANRLPFVGTLAMKRHVLIRKAQRSYNDAIETATELLRENPALAHLFDREVADGMGDEMEGIVRPKSSAHEFANPVPDWELRSLATIQRRHAGLSLDALGVASHPVSLTTFEKHAMARRPLHRY